MAVTENLVQGTSFGVPDGKSRFHKPRPHRARSRCVATMVLHLYIEWG